ncbi:Gfo/Idh/MocA family protein [Larkinella arboricola]
MNASEKPIRGTIVAGDRIQRSPGEVIAGNPEARRALHNALMRHQDGFDSLPNRYSTALHRLKDVITSGVLGNIRLVQVSCYWKRDEGYYTSGSWHGRRELTEDALYTHFFHYINLLHNLFGGIKPTEARLMNLDHPTDRDDNGFVLFSLSGGGTGCLSFATATWGSTFENSLTLLAENGSMKVSGDYLDRVDYCYIRNHNRPEWAPAT